MNRRSEWREILLSEVVQSHETPEEPGQKYSPPARIHHVTRRPHSPSFPVILLQTLHKKYHLQTKLYPHDPRQGCDSLSTMQLNPGLQPRGQSHELPSRQL